MPAPHYSYTSLSSTEVVPERPFTAVSFNVGDVQAIRVMAQRLNAVVNGSTDLLAQPRPLRLTFVESNGRDLRIIVSQPDRLHPQDLFCVGFFGQKNPNIDSKIIEGVDTALLAELPSHSAVLAYCTLYLEDGNYGNLVVLSEDTAREQWRESPYHQQAVAEVAPRYYASVRLHNGVLRGGLQTEPDVHLIRTKYYDYRNGFWCGLRELA